MSRQTPVAEKVQQDTADPSGPRRDPRLLSVAASPRGWWHMIKRNIRSGELGAAPVVIGLLLIAIVFQTLNDRFLSPQNLSNLTVQIAAIGLMTTGVIMVLLLGEIDLSLGSVDGLDAGDLGVTGQGQGRCEWAG